jgi:hypothetical protein
MSKSRLVKNWEEARLLFLQYQSGQFTDHLFIAAIVQLVEREKIRVLNGYLSKRGEELIPTDAPRLPGGERFEWIIDVPKDWISETGRRP